MTAKRQRNNWKCCKCWRKCKVSLNEKDSSFPQSFTLCIVDGDTEGANWIRDDNEEKDADQ